MSMLVSIIPLWLRRLGHPHQCICLTPDSSPTPIQHMGVDHCCADIPVTEELLPRRGSCPHAHRSTSPDTPPATPTCPGEKEQHPGTHSEPGKAQISFL